MHLIKKFLLFLVCRADQWVNEPPRAPESLRNPPCPPLRSARERDADYAHKLRVIQARKKAMLK